MFRTIISRYVVLALCFCLVALSVETAFINHAYATTSAMPRALPELEPLIAGPSKSFDILRMKGKPIDIAVGKTDELFVLYRYKELGPAKDIVYRFGIERYSSDTRKVVTSIELPTPAQNSSALPSYDILEATDNGDLLIGSSTGHSIYVISATLEPSSFGEVPFLRGSSDFMKSISYMADISETKGILYISDSLGQIASINMNNLREENYWKPDSHFGQFRPWGIDSRAYQGSGSYFVASDILNSALLMADTNAPTVDWGRSSLQLDTPFGVALSDSGDVAVADSGNSRVAMFDSSGKFQGSLGAEGCEYGQLKYPVSVDIDSKGAVYVVDKLCSEEARRPGTGYLLDDYNYWVTIYYPRAQGPSDNGCGSPINSRILNTLCVAVDKMYIPVKPEANNSNSDQAIDQEQLMSADGGGKKSCRVRIRRSQKSAKSNLTHDAVYRRTILSKIRGKVVQARPGAKCRRGSLMLIEKRGSDYFLPGTPVKIKRDYLYKSVIKQIARRVRINLGLGYYSLKQRKRYTRFTFTYISKKSKYGPYLQQQLGNKFNSALVRGKLILLYIAPRGKESEVVDVPL